MYALHKWYFDLTTPRDEYVFLYVASLRLFGFHACELHLSFSRLGSQEVLAVERSLGPAAIGDGGASIRTRAGSIVLAGGGASIRLRAGQVEIALRYGGAPAGDRPAAPFVIPGRRGAIRWLPVLLGASASGTIRAGGREISVRDDPGYGDYVSSTLFPLAAPVDELFWGRMHHPRCDLTFTVATGAGPGARWSRLVLRLDGRTWTLDDVDLRVEASGWAGAEPRPERYVLSARGDGLRVSLSVEHLQTAAVSEVLGRGGGLRWLERRVLNAVARRPRGAKFFARADLAVDRAEGGEERILGALLIDEYVRFGRPAVSRPHVSARAPAM